jgi:hypothetical protein
MALELQVSFICLSPVSYNVLRIHEPENLKDPNGSDRDVVRFAGLSAWLASSKTLGRTEQPPGCDA